MTRIYGISLVILVLSGIFLFGITGWKDRTDPDVIVAVIDTAYNHSVFAGEKGIWQNRDEINGNGIDDDGNGYVDDFYGWDFCRNRKECWTKQSDPTHGSVVIQSFRDEIRRDKRNVQVMLLTALNDQEKGNVRSIIEAIQYAENSGATICCLSIASPVDHDSLREKIKGSKMRFVVPAGNHGMELNAQFRCYPASYKFDNITTVGALDLDASILDRSNYGKDVDEYCNGIVIVGKQRYEGTSVACGRMAARLAVNNRGCCTKR